MNWAEQVQAIFPRDGGYIEPLSERWRQARRGTITGSERAHKIARPTAKNWPKLVETLRAELQPDWQWQELNGVRALNWGRKNELRAIANIELALAADLVEPGLVFHPDYPYAGATADALLDDVVIEIKCPHNHEVHLKNLYLQKLTGVYYTQIQWEMWIHAAARGLFVSYDPRQPLATQLSILEVSRDEELIDTFEKNLAAFRRTFETGVGPTTGQISLKSMPAFF